MIDLDYLKKILEQLQFRKENENIFSRYFHDIDVCLKVDFDKQEFIYPEDRGLRINERQTCNFSANENLVVFECVCRLIERS